MIIGSGWVGLQNSQPLFPSVRLKKPPVFQPSKGITASALLLRICLSYTSCFIKLFIGYLFFKPGFVIQFSFGACLVLTRAGNIYFCWRASYFPDACRVPFTSIPLLVQRLISWRVPVPFTSIPVGARITSWRVPVLFTFNPCLIAGFQNYLKRRI